MKKRYFELEIIGDGGEYTAGVISDKEKLKFLSELASNKELSFSNDTDIDNDDYSFEYVSCSEHIDILVSYGINVGSATFKVREILVKNREEFKQIEVDYIDKKEIIWSGAKLPFVTFNNPYFIKEEVIKEYGKDSLVLMGVNYEKRMRTTYLIETSESGFNVDNLLLGTCRVDNVIGYEDELIDEVLYIDKKELYSFIDKELLNKKSDVEVYQSKLKEWKDKLDNNYKNNLSMFIKETSELLKESNGILPHIDSNEYSFNKFNCQKIKSFDGRGYNEDVLLVDLNNEEV